MLECVITSDPEIPVEPVFHRGTPLVPPLTPLPPKALTPVQELERKDRASFENSRKFMPLNTIEGLTVAVQDIRESLIEIKNSIGQIRTEDIKSLHKESDDLRKFHNRLVGAGALFSVILGLLIALGAYFSERWEGAYAMSQSISGQLPGILATERENSDEIGKIDKKLEDTDKARLETRMDAVEQKVLNLELVKKPEGRR